MSFENKDIITIVDYGMGNLRSIEKAFFRVGFKTIVTSNSQEVRRSDKIVLPGVGHFARGMENLEKLGLIDALNEKALAEKIPVFGICLGMQLFSTWGEEGNRNGLGWVDADTVHFQAAKMESSLKIPHMGWNSIRNMQAEGILGLSGHENSFYFVHSYHMMCKSQSDELAKTEYGYEFTSAVKRGNIIGTQFHPEKSHEQGLQLLSQFAHM